MPPQKLSKNKRETAQDDLGQLRRTRRSTGAAGRVFSQIEGFRPPPGYLCRSPTRIGTARHRRHSDDHSRAMDSTIGRCA